MAVRAEQREAPLGLSPTCWWQFTAHHCAPQLCLWHTAAKAGPPPGPGKWTTHLAQQRAQRGFSFTTFPGLGAHQIHASRPGYTTVTRLLQSWAPSPSPGGCPGMSGLGADRAPPCAELSASHSGKPDQRRAPSWCNMWSQAMEIPDAVTQKPHY